MSLSEHTQNQPTSKAQTPFEAPEGYFDGLHEKLVQRQQLLTSLKAGQTVAKDRYLPFHTPIHYFDSLLARVQARLSTQPVALPAWVQWSYSMAMILVVLGFGSLRFLGTEASTTIQEAAVAHDMHAVEDIMSSDPMLATALVEEVQNTDLENIAVRDVHQAMVKEPQALLSGKIVTPQPVQESMSVLESEALAMSLMTEDLVGE